MEIFALAPFFVKKYLLQDEKICSLCEQIISFNLYMPSVLKQRTLASGVDPDQTPQNAASDQGIHCLH